MKNNNNNQKIVTGKGVQIAFVCVSIFLAITFFVWTVFPYAQMATYIKNFEIAMTGDMRPLEQSSFSFSPYTSVQPALRHKFLTHLFEHYKAGKLSSAYAPLVQLSIDKMIEVTDSTDHFPHYFTSIAKAYDELADFIPTEAMEYHSKAEVYYKKALALSPNNFNPDNSFAYSINLTNQRRNAEAITLLRKVLSYDTRIADTHYFLGLILFKAGAENNNEALEHLEFALDKNVNPSPSITKKVYQNMLIHYYKKQDATHFVTVIKRLVTMDTDQKDTYEQILGEIEKTNNIPLLNVE